jgi:hypothetical protein
MATVQLRNPTEGRAYFDRKKADGKTSNEAMRALKRRLSDIVYRHMVDDAITNTVTGPGGHGETSLVSSVTGSHSHTGSSDQSLPGPATAYDPSAGSLLTQRGAMTGSSSRVNTRVIPPPVDHAQRGM